MQLRTLGLKQLEYGNQNMLFFGSEINQLILVDNWVVKFVKYKYQKYNNYAGFSKLLLGLKLAYKLGLLAIIWRFTITWLNLLPYIVTINYKKEAAFNISRMFNVIAEFVSTVLLCNQFYTGAFVGCLRVAILMQ
eukprot:TRINITY_DN3128_c0_g1_i1.p2 TRINITY_DN3128_c0_g1~~TRINITY_DN3128_c0_g1_i1.p2  ORF type:complete len:153 (+),score=5.65 TRINITY_DN3128_c0_g1_i1:55-459(+)